MQSTICHSKINLNRFSTTSWKPLRCNIKADNNIKSKISRGYVDSLHSRLFTTQSRGPKPLKYDPKYNSYFGVAHPSNWKSPIKVTVTGSSGQIGYSLVGRIASGEVFGKDQPVHLTLLESIETDRDSYGVIHEIKDGTYPLLRSIQKMQGEEGAFDGADYVIMAHSKPATEIDDETLRKVFHKQEEWEVMDDLTRRKAKQIAIDFHNLHAAYMQAIYIHNMANLYVKVFVIAEPVARMCNLVSHFVPRLEEKFITGLSRMHHNRFTSMLAREFQCRPSDIEHAFVWGSTADTYIPDFSSVLVKGKPLRECVKGDFESWKHRMVDTFIKRGVQIHDSIKDSTTALANDLCASWRFFAKSSYLIHSEFFHNILLYVSSMLLIDQPKFLLSATSAAIQHLQDWIHGTNGKWTSMVVSSDKHYGKSNPIYSHTIGIEPGQFASMPVVCENGEYKIVEDLHMEPWLEHRMKQHYESENVSCGRDLEDFIEYSQWFINLSKRGEEKLVSFPSPEEVSKMDEGAQKLIRRRVSFLNPLEATTHDRSWYPTGFEVTSSTPILKSKFNKFPNTWSTKGPDLDVVTLVDTDLDRAIFTEEDEIFLFDYRKAILHGVEPQEWWPKWMEFKEKTKDPKGMATVYEGVIESLLDIESKTGHKIFTPETLQAHRQKIEEIKNMSPELKRVKETFNELEQAMIPESSTDKLPQKPRPNISWSSPRSRPTFSVEPIIDITEQVLYDKWGRPLIGIFGELPDKEKYYIGTEDTIEWLEKYRTAPPASPYPEQPKEKEQKALDAENQVKSEKEAEKQKEIEDRQQMEEEEEEEEEEQLPEKPTYAPTFWLRELDNEDLDPFDNNPGEKAEDFLAPQHRALWDVIQEAKAKGLKEVRQEIELAPQDLEFLKKQRVPKTNIIDLSYIPKSGLPLRNVPEDKAPKEEQQ